MTAQDFDVGMAYYPNCLGFNRTEADHIWRPFELRIWKSDSLKKSFDESCSERHLEMMDYLEKFMRAYPGTPKVAQVWPTTLAHETLKNLYHADEQFLAFFKKNRELIDQSFFIMVGDHGPRREGIGETRLGQYENLNPFLIVLIPSKYRNTSIHHQLYKKSNELITHFDLHATLMDILKVRKIISKRFCCHLTKLGNFFAEQLNEFLRYSGLKDKCQMQYYNYVWINRIKTGIFRLWFFQAHVRSSSAGLKLSSGFSRLNRYGRQGDCLVGNPLRPLCHC
ncbi:hypothetical protein Angca_000161, partial [Angiostrongylus cantonensis]